MRYEKRYKNKRCVHCGKEFTPKSSRQICCNRSEWLQYVKKPWIPVEKVCVICGIKYMADVWHPHQETCGKPICYRRRYKILNTEKLRQDGKRNRERIWFDGKREDALKRDGYKCVRCGATRNIHVHHKDGKGRGYRGKINNSLDNLETLCNICHQKHHHELSAFYNKGVYQMGVARYWDKSNREIAKILNISHATVGDIRKVVTQKLGLGLGQNP